MEVELLGLGVIGRIEKSELPGLLDPGAWESSGAIHVEGLTWAIFECLSPDALPGILPPIPLWPLQLNFQKLH